jgi:hypothetical protein
MLSDARVDQLNANRAADVDHDIAYGADVSTPARGHPSPQS